ncbi:acyltransferase family protein [Gallionella capsiferriformans]|uniref:Acyltransferase 3 n=1 Tax=Gallionella capsiferriformans (strain ES-2) TaxID=395494 RepID=D9SFL7_GALCS|nr:acyltransferase [Gallionella capsiferriformans]ADL55314.1 acyltransferase 3 [Gallionella capsiferriformans ES-2]
MSATGNRFEYIEISRGIAALLVVCFHATGISGLTKYFGMAPLGGLFSFGYAGVDFFFVLSGFIIFYSTATNHANSSEIFSYIKHRLIRIYPIYWVVGFILLPLTYLMGHRVGVVNAVMDFLLVPREGYPFVPVAWTLRHEMLFYVSFMLFFLNVTLAWVYFLLWGVAIVLCGLFSLDFASPFASLYFNDHNLEFLLGIGIAQYAKSNQVLLIKPSFLFLGGAAIFIASGLNESLIHVGNYPEHGHYHLLYGVGAVLMIGGLIRLEADLKNYWVGMGTFLGRASYSIYLIHFAVLSAVVKLLVPLHFPLWLDLVLLVLSSVVIGSLLYQYVEVPLLAMIRSRGALASNVPARV